MEDNRGRRQQHPELVVVHRVRCSSCEGYGGEFNNYPSQDHRMKVERYWDACRMCKGMGYQERVPDA